MTRAQQLRSLHPDTNGGDHSRVAEFVALMEKLRNVCRCGCNAPLRRKGGKFLDKLHFQLHRRGQTAQRMIGLLALLLAGCAVSKSPQPQPVAAPRPQIAMRQQAIVEAPMLPIAPAAALAAAVPGKAVTLEWSPGPDSSVTGYRIYASTNNKLDFQLIGTATGTNVIVTNTFLPTYYFVTAVDVAGTERAPSNTIGLLGEIATVTVTGQHAPTVAGPWLAYAAPVFSGTTTNQAEVYRLVITRTNQWDTVSTP